MPLRVGLALVAGGFGVLRQSRSIGEFYQTLGEEGSPSFGPILGKLLLIGGGVAIAIGIAQLTRRNDP